MFHPVLIAAALTLAAPYTDTQGRFTLDLPEGWALAPRFGDTAGMRFARTWPSRQGGGEGTLTITVGGAADADAAAGRASARLKAEGWRVRRGPEPVGGRTGVRLEARRGGRVQRAYFVGAGGQVYAMVAEARLADHRRLKADLRTVLASFRPRSGAAAPAAEAPPPPLPKRRAPKVVGRYIGPSGVPLELTEAGHFTLGGAAGRYEIDARTLVLVPDGGAEVRFSWSRRDDGALVLQSPGLKAPAVYAPESAAARSGGAITGRWVAKGASGQVELVLRPDGTFTLADVEGQWVAEGGALRLRKSDTEVIGYRYRRVGATLRLTGGDLEDEVVFRAAP